MRPSVDVWQGCSGYWPSAFVRENLLLLGHAAWQGYLTQGRGMVGCTVATVEAPELDWRETAVKFNAQYLSTTTIRPYLQSHHVPQENSDRLMVTVQAYQPSQELLLAISWQGQIEIDWLRNLAIAPPDCYRQVCDRWDEFDLKSSNG